MKKIVLTGGGSAGHVTPNLALLPYLKEKNYEIHYIGSYDGIEREMLSHYPEILYHPIRTGKLRRYLSAKNLTDPFRVIAGCGDAKKIMKEIRPDVLFSKGGFVSVPAVLAAHGAKIPVITHESDMTPGLANKIIKPFAARICVTFPETLQYVPDGKGIVVGTPIRDMLFHGDAAKARRMLAFSDNARECILVMGGSLGARAINEAVRANLGALCEKYNVIHLCGKKNLAPQEEIAAYAGSYRQFEFVSDELPDLLAFATCIISRAGSNAIHEFAALHKPMLLIPLPLSASRGDQILNAKSFEKRGLALVLGEEKMDNAAFLEAVKTLFLRKKELKAALEKEPAINATNKIVEIIENAIDTHGRI